MTSQTKTKGKDSSDVKQFDKVQEKDSESKHISTKTNLWKFNPK
jgi:hypothetical protein